MVVIFSRHPARYYLSGLSIRIIHTPGNERVGEYFRANRDVVFHHDRAECTRTAVEGGSYFPRIIRAGIFILIFCWIKIPGNNSTFYLGVAVMGNID
jgi:hypothetical protein